MAVGDHSRGDDGLSGRGRGLWDVKLGFDLVFDPPFAEGALIQMQPMLLRADDHTRAHETHKGNDFVGREAVAIDQISANETPCPTKTCLAVHGDASVLDGDHFVSELDEFVDDRKGRTGSIFEYHVNVGDS